MLGQRSFARSACWLLLLLFTGCQADSQRVRDGDIRVPGGSQVGSLEHVVAVEGNLVIKQTQLASLALPSLRTVSGDVVIEGNERLKTLTGLENLTWIGGSLRVEGNDGLVHLAGLNALFYVGGDLRIARNAVMETLDGLERLVEVGGAVSIVGNPAMTGFTGLRNLRSIGHGIEIRDQPRIESMDGLDPMTLTGDTKLEGNDRLPYVKVQAWRQNLWARGWVGDSHHRNDSIGISGHRGAPRPPISIIPAEPRVGGEHSPEEIGLTTARFLRQLRFCYERYAFGLGESTEGRVTVGWTIALDGQVESVRVIESTLPDPWAVDCMSRSIRTWRFARSAGLKTTQVVQSWAFRQPE